jgi:ElaB/YqjD/DUF883 family membrane-anchored ribosome-binding protein
MTNLAKTRAKAPVVELGSFRAAQVRQRVSDVIGLFGDNTRRYLRANPWQVVGAVAVLGAAAGFLLTYSNRRSRRERDSDAASMVSGG